MTPGFAANYLTGTMVLLYRPFHRDRLISRFAPHKVLAAYALFAMLLCRFPPLAADISACWR